MKFLALKKFLFFRSFSSDARILLWVMSSRAKDSGGYQKVLDGFVWLSISSKIDIYNWLRMEFFKYLIRFGFVKGELGD